MPDWSQSPSEECDEELAARVAQGDVAAFTLLYDRYARAVYVLAVHLVGQGEAEAIVQEVFLRLWNKADHFDAERGSFRSWFMTLARNHLFDELRHRNKEWSTRVLGEIEPLLTEVADPNTDVEEEVWQHERREILLRALGNLPPEQRRALVLAYFGGLSQSSIARNLGGRSAQSRNVSAWDCRSCVVPCTSMRSPKPGMDHRLRTGSRSDERVRYHQRAA